MAQSPASNPTSSNSQTAGHYPGRPWITRATVGLYLIALAALVFLPGQTLIQRLQWLDSGICAQLPSHSFYPAGQRLPLCARNTGIYLGFSLTLITLLTSPRRKAQLLPPWPLLVLLVAGVLAMAIDGVNSLFLDLRIQYLYRPHNLIRLATGLLTGLALATLSLPIANRMFWRAVDDRRSLTGPIDLGLLLPVLLLGFLAVASQNAFLLYPLALLSTFGLMTVVSFINLIVIVAVRKQDETFERYRDLFPYFSLALLLACGELFALAQIKFNLFQLLKI